MSSHIHTPNFGSESSGALPRDFICMVRETHEGFSAMLTPSLHTNPLPPSDSITDAIASALGVVTASFASSDDELLACRAVLRGRSIHVAIADRVITNLGFGR